jgi:hypothetical protein
LPFGCNLNKLNYARDLEGNFMAQTSKATTKRQKKSRKIYKPSQVTKEQMKHLKGVVDVLMIDISDEGLERLALSPFCSICATTVLCSITK